MFITLLPGEEKLPGSHTSQINLERIMSVKNDMKRVKQGKKAGGSLTQDRQGKPLGSDTCVFIQVIFLLKRVQ